MLNYCVACFIVGCFVVSSLFIGFSYVFLIYSAFASPKYFIIFKTCPFGIPISSMCCLVNSVYDNSSTFEDLDGVDTSFEKEWLVLREIEGLEELVELRSGLLLFLDWLRSFLTAPALGLRFFIFLFLNYGFKLHQPVFLR